MQAAVMSSTPHSSHPLMIAWRTLTVEDEDTDEAWTEDVAVMTVR